MVEFFTLLEIQLILTVVPWECRITKVKLSQLDVMMWTLNRKSVEQKQN